MEKNIAKYTKDADKLAMEAQVQNMSLLHESNAFRKRCLLLREDLEISAAKIQKL